MLNLKSFATLLVVMALAATLQAQPAEDLDYSPTATADYPIALEGYPRLAFDPSGARLAAALRKGPGQDGRVVFFSVPDLTEIREVVTDAEPRAVGYNKSGDLFGVAVSEDANLKFAVLSTTSRDWPTTYSNNDIEDVVSVMAFDPLGELLMVGGRQSGKLTRFEIGPWTRQDVPAMDGLSGGCRSLSVSSDGRFGAAGTVSSVLYVWPMDDTGPAAKLGVNRFRGAITSVTFSRDAQFLAAGDDRGQVMVFYLTPDNRWAWKGMFALPAGGVTSVLFLKDNSLVTASSFGVVSRWNVDKPDTPVETMNLGTGNAEVLALDPKGYWMAVAGSKIHLFPVGTAEETREMPNAPVTVVDRTTPEQMTDFVEMVPSVPMSPPVSEGSVPSSESQVAASSVPSDEDLRNFVLWMAPDSAGGDGDDWIQGRAAYLDSGIYSPIQLVIPFSGQNAAAIKTNLNNLNNVVRPNDFLALYASAVLCPTQEKNDFRISFGSFLNEKVRLSVLIRALEDANKKGPVVWFLDLVPSPELSEAQTNALLPQVATFLAAAVETVDPGEVPPARKVGVGLLTLSKNGCYKDLTGSLREALSGRADTNGDGRTYDRELMLYLVEQCRSAIRATAIGDPQAVIPALPAFRLDTR